MSNRNQDDMQIFGLDRKNDLAIIWKKRKTKGGAGFEG